MFGIANERRVTTNDAQECHELYELEINRIWKLKHVLLILLYLNFIQYDILKLVSETLNTAKSRY